MYIIDMRGMYWPQDVANINETSSRLMRLKEIILGCFIKVYKYL